jgi:hypothetical protein
MHSRDQGTSNALRSGDNASQHSGDESVPWSHRNPSMATGRPAFLQGQVAQQGDTLERMLATGIDDMHSKEMDYQEADKDERRFRSARLQKRAEREGPQLTQARFCALLYTCL